MSSNDLFTHKAEGSFEKKKVKKNNCEKCGVSKDEFIEVSKNLFFKGLILHHLIPKNKNGSNKKDNLITLCNKCHREIHTIEGKLNYTKINVDVTNNLLLKKYENQKC